MDFFLLMDAEPSWVLLKAIASWSLIKALFCQSSDEKKKTKTVYQVINLPTWIILIKIGISETRVIKHFSTLQIPGN